MENFNHDIPEKLKEDRKKLGFTQKQIAEKIGITRDSIANYETGRLRTPLDVYLKIKGLLSENQKGAGQE